MEAVIGTADAVRREIWRALVRTRLGRACARDRATRLAAIGVLHVATALAFTATAPLALMLLGPLLLGAPHVIADVRWLVVDPVVARGRARLAVLAPLAAMTLLRALSLVGVDGLQAYEAPLGAAAIVLAVLLSDGTIVARAGIVAIALAVGAGGALRPATAVLLLAHAHNLVGIALWAGWSRRHGARGRVLVVLAAVAAGVILLATGVVAPPTTRWIGFGGLDGAALVASLAPGLAPETAVRLVAVYAFLQAVHYAVWLRLVPGVRDARPSPATFRRTLADLRAAFGKPAFAVAAALAIALPLAALAGAARARDVYLSLVVFHGWLELAAAGRLVAEAA